ncbi:MAG: DUF4276 family protein [Phycisphaerales bacterium]|nr:DUF4276 family protein [Phycisphaerales bacterium]
MFIIQPIVEGHGEVESIRGLLDSIWRALGASDVLEVLRPIRNPRSKLITEEGLRRAVGLGASKLRERGGRRGLVLVLVDSNGDCPAEVGPRLCGWARATAGDVRVDCSLAKIEYETWFVASAESLSEYLDLDPHEAVPEDPEGQRCGKAWIQRRFVGHYNETLGQPRLTAALDVGLCRRRSPSFDRLCRVVGRLASEREARGET